MGAQLEVPVPTAEPDDRSFSAEALLQVTYDKPSASCPAEIVGQGADRKIVGRFPASASGSNNGADTCMLKTDNYTTPNGSTSNPAVAFALDNEARQTTATSALTAVLSQASLKVDKVKHSPTKDPHVGSEVTYPRVWIGDGELKTGTMTNGLKERCYVLVETKAPAGFVLPDDAPTEVVVKPGAVTEFSAKVKNVQQEVPELPMTGGAGQVLLVVGCWWSCVGGGCCWFGDDHTPQIGNGIKTYRVRRP
ncbi:SpaA isopeptide-forming pilin-related protein [Leucobacter chinensis]|uniref:SpaA isopeptide-forming pilin-related protein n=1 Tax=Leucobacter chinensis TaxID=2851010 RepID=UPI001C243BE9|nr:SpaA isopeptide-forming pilin-related protein [Leucobacter chinensis]